MRIVEWLQLTWLEHRLSRKGFRRLQHEQAAELGASARRHVHDVGDALLALTEMSNELERVLAEMESRGGADDVPPDPEPS